MSSIRYLGGCDATYVSERELMLVESLVKATVELQGFRVESVTGATSGLVAVVVADLRFSPRCGQCLEPARYRDTRPVRRFRHVPMWGIPVELRYEPRRVSCPRCAGVHVEAMPWVSGKQRMTRALVVTLATWTRLLPWEQVARLFHCAWGTVATAVEEAVVYGLANRDLEGLTHIGIDEISRKRGHVYVTNVYDLERKRLVWSGEGRKQETLEAFFDYLGPEKTAALEGICCDMWQPYIDVIKDRAPQAVLVFDKFHIVRHLMEAVDQVRRDEIREKGSEHKALMYNFRIVSVHGLRIRAADQRPADARRGHWRLQVIELAEEPIKSILAGVCLSDPLFLGFSGDSSPGLEVRHSVPSPYGATYPSNRASGYILPNTSVLRVGMFSLIRDEIRNPLGRGGTSAYSDKR